MRASRFAELADPGRLRERLAAAFAARARPVEVAVGVAAGGRTAIACTGSATLRAGCLTKLFTAALARGSCTAGRLALEAQIGPILAPGAKRLVGITLRQLLEHTHGLDDSLLEAVPRRGDGCIDAPRLVASVTAAAPIARPGSLYSYSNAGAWLTAAVLERVTGEPYDRLLGALIEPLDAAVAAPHGPAPASPGPAPSALAAPKGICPATGGSLTVGLPAMLEFLRRHAPSAAAAGLEDGSRASPIVPLPGWHALERGVHVGWKYHGGGWFGHQSVWPRASALVRVQPCAGLALVVASGELPAAVATAKLFGDRLPELASLEIPRPLDETRVRALDPQRYEGVYRCARRLVLIARQDNGDLTMRTGRLGTDGVAREPSVCTALRAAEGDVFFAETPLPGGFSYVQFVSPCADGFRHLWNGRSLLRKVSCRRA